MTGCDTTSALYRQGKKKAFNLLRKHPELDKCVKEFNGVNSSVKAVAAAGEEFLLALYEAANGTSSLNRQRHHCFTKAVAKCPIHTKIQLAALSPTSAAAKEHSLRAYHQVQLWLGRDLPPTEWGWDLVSGQLRPVLTRQPPAPEGLLNLISCNCKCGCERGCGCRKAGIQCSVVCGYCRGSGCSNSEMVDTDEDGEPQDENHNDHGQTEAENSDEEVTYVEQDSESLSLADPPVSTLKRKRKHRAK